MVPWYYRSVGWGAYTRIWSYMLRANRFVVLNVNLTSECGPEAKAKYPISDSSTCVDRLHYSLMSIKLASDPLPLTCGRAVGGNVHCALMGLVVLFPFHLATRAWQHSPTAPRSQLQATAQLFHQHLSRPATHWPDVNQDLRKPASMSYPCQCGDGEIKAEFFPLCDPVVLTVSSPALIEALSGEKIFDMPEAWHIRICLVLIELLFHCS